MGKKEFINCTDANKEMIKSIKLIMGTIIYDIEFVSQGDGFHAPRVHISLYKGIKDGGCADNYEIWYNDGILVTKGWIVRINNGEWNRFEENEEVINFIQENLRNNNYIRDTV